MLDSLRTVDTPEGVELSLPIAGAVLRARAWFCDIMIKMLLMFLASFAAVLGGAGEGMLMIVMFLLTWLYSVFFEVLRGGATPGKTIVGLRVVHDDGMPVGWSASFIRSLVGFIDVIPGVGLVASMLNSDSKRLGDMAAGTVVIHEIPAKMRRPRRMTVEPRRPPIPLLIDEQRGLVEFAMRAPGLSESRLQELARAAKPLTSDNGDAVNELLGQARWIAGDR